MIESPEISYIKELPEVYIYPNYVPLAECGTW